MGELRIEQLGENTYWIKNRSNVGIYRTGDNTVALIDTGYYRDAEAIDSLLVERGWVPEYIVNTHTHLDHVSGNGYFMEKYGISAYCSTYEVAFDDFADLEPAIIYGGYADNWIRDMFGHRHKLGMRDIASVELPGLEVIDLPGHSPGHIGFVTSDGIVFTGDTYLSLKYLERHSFAYTYRIDAMLDSLDALRAVKGKLYVPAHGGIETDLMETLDANVDNIERQFDVVLTRCQDWTGMDELVAHMVDFYDLPEDYGYNLMVQSVTRSILAHLQDSGRMERKIRDNIFKYKVADR